MKPRQISAVAKLIMRLQDDPDWAYRARKHSTLTLEEMARLCDVDKATISRWERGQSIPRDERVAVYADLLERFSLCERANAFVQEAHKVALSSQTNSEES